MKIRYGVELPNKGRRMLSETSSAIDAFISRGEKTMELTFETQQDALRARSTACSYIKHHDMSGQYAVSVRRTKVYVFKKGE